MSEFSSSRTLVSERLLRARSFSEPNSHIVQFYSEDARFAGAIGDLVYHALLSQQSAVVIGTRSHRAVIDALLLERIPDLSQLRENGRYLSIDAAAMLAKFVNNNDLDEYRFYQLATEIVEQAIAHSADGTALIFGEIVGLLCADHNMRAAVELEQFWNRLRRSYRFDLVCAYPLSSFATQSGASDLIRVCAEHTLTMPADGPL